MSENDFPPGWDEQRVRRVIDHYGTQTDEEAVAGDEAAFAQEQTLMQVPVNLVPVVRAMIAEQQKERSES